MYTKILSSLAVATAALVSVSAANAAVSIYSNVPATSPYSGPTPTFNFDPGSQPVYAGGSIVTGDVFGSYITPTGSTGNYYAVGPDTTTPGTISLVGLGPIYTISFLWGSVDPYNMLTFLGTGATFSGTDILAGADGSQSQLVTFLLTGSDATSLTGLTLDSKQNAFEIDNLAINPVPEPGTWALMLLGFGAIGLSMRSRRRRMLSQLA